MLYLVMQHGGSSTELYPQLFSQEEDAKRYVLECELASYDCDGPFELHNVCWEDKKNA